MKVLICGGRDVGRSGMVTDALSAETAAEATQASREILFVNNKLDDLHAQLCFSHVICGSSKGAERLGLDWAQLKGIPTTIFKSRGILFRRETVNSRNLRMLKDGQPDMCIAFGGAEVTEDLLSHAAGIGIKIIRSKFG